MLGERWRGKFRYQFPVGRHGERFFLARCIHAPQFDMAAALGHDGETNFCKIEATSGPESLRSLGIRWFNFHGDQQSRVLGQTEGSQVLAIKVEGNGFLQVAHNLIQGLALAVASLRDESWRRSQFCSLLLIS